MESKTTKLKINDTTISIESDDPNMHEFIARLVVERATLNTAAPVPVRETTDDVRAAVRELVKSCRVYDTQHGVLKALAKSGRATRSQMRAAGGMDAEGKFGNRSLAGCRGSMSKRALSLGLGRDWWHDSYSPQERDHVAELRLDVFEALKEVIGES